MKKSASLLVCLLALSACADRTSAIAPAHVGSIYNNLPCRQAASELETERRVFAALSAGQDAAATADSVGVFVLGLPVGTMGGGDRAGDIAASKGKIQALEARMMTCRSTNGDGWSW